MEACRQKLADGFVMRGMLFSDLLQEARKHGSSGFSRASFGEGGIVLESFWNPQEGIWEQAFPFRGQALYGRVEDDIEIIVLTEDL